MRKGLWVILGDNLDAGMAESSLGGSLLAKGKGDGVETKAWMEVGLSRPQPCWCRQEVRGVELYFLPVVVPATDGSCRSTFAIVMGSAQISSLLPPSL